LTAEPSAEVALAADGGEDAPLATLAAQPLATILPTATLPPPADSASADTTQSEAPAPPTTAPLPPATSGATTPLNVIEWLIVGLGLAFAGLLLANLIAHRRA
jgi:hypothetical protein